MTDRVSDRTAKREEPKGLARVANRVWQYFNYGYQILSPPFVLIGLGSIIWSYVKPFYPFSLLHYAEFIILLFAVGLPFTVGFGWFMYKNTHIYGQSLSVAVENNPYSHWKVTPKEAISWRVSLMFCRQFNTDGRFDGLTQDIKSLLARNGYEAE